MFALMGFSSLADEAGRNEECPVNCVSSDLSIVPTKTRGLSQVNTKTCLPSFDSDQASAYHSLSTSTRGLDETSTSVLFFGGLPSPQGFDMACGGKDALTLARWERGEGRNAKLLTKTN